MSAGETGIDAVVPSLDTVMVIGIVLVVGFAGYVGWKAYRGATAITDTVSDTIGDVKDAIGDAVGAVTKPVADVYNGIVAGARGETDATDAMEAHYDAFGNVMGYSSHGYDASPVAADSPDAAGLVKPEGAW